MDEEKERGEDFKKVVKLQALVRRFITRSKHTKTNNSKQNNYFKPKYEKVIFWNDKNYTFNWKFKKPILSNKDKKISNN